MILQLPFHQNSCFFLPIQQEFNTLEKYNATFRSNKSKHAG